MTYEYDPSGLHDMGDLDPNRFTIETRAQWDEYMLRCRALMVAGLYSKRGMAISNAAGDRITVRSMTKTSVIFHCVRKWTKERRRAEFVAQQKQLETGVAHPTLARTYEYEVRWDG
jgi:hypothetical protein